MVSTETVHNIHNVQAVTVQRQKQWVLCILGFKSLISKQNTYPFNNNNSFVYTPQML